MFTSNQEMAISNLRQAIAHLSSILISIFSLCSVEEFAHDTTLRFSVSERKFIEYLYDIFMFASKNMNDDQEEFWKNLMKKFPSYRGFCLQMQNLLDKREDIRDFLKKCLKAKKENENEKEEDDDGIRFADDDEEIDEDQPHSSRNPPRGKKRKLPSPVPPAPPAPLPPSIPAQKKRTRVGRSERKALGIAPHTPTDYQWFHTYGERNKRRRGNT